MKSILIQFHTLPNEIKDLVRQFAEDNELTVLKVLRKPFCFSVLIEQGHVKDFNISHDTDSVRLVILKNLVHRSSCTSSEFFDSNPGAIVVDIGAQTDVGIYESAMSFRSDDVEGISIATRLAAIIRRRTKAGVFARNPDTGARVRLKSHRYSQGAKAAYETGTPLFALGGKNTIELDEPSGP